MSIPTTVLENLIRYDQKEYPFSDHFAQFSVAYPAGGPVGIGPLHPKSVLSTYSISAEALQLWLIEDGQPVAVQRRSLTSHPWAASEEAVIHNPAGTALILRVQTQTVFLDERGLVCAFTFTNVSDAAQTFQPAWMGSIIPDTKRYMLHYFPGAIDAPRESFVAAVKRGIRGGLRNPNPADLPEAGMQITCDHPQMQVWVGAQPYWADSDAPSMQQAAQVEHPVFYALQLPAQTLEPGQAVSVQFCLRVTFASYLNPGLIWPQEHFSTVDVAALTQANRERFEKEICLESLPANLSPALQSKMIRARFALLRDGLRGLDGEFGEQIASLCTADNSDFSCSFFWDSLFSSVAITDFHREYARGAIRTTFTRHLSRDGSTPERKFNYSVPQRMLQQSPQSPIAAWAVQEYLRRYNDPAFLEEMYPLLHANHRFWDLYSDTDRDGLAEYRWSGQICDNSPLWDDYSSYTGISGCGWLPPVASVTLNSFLYWDAAVMKTFAQTLGRAGDVQYYTERLSSIEKALYQVCYVPEERRFWDFNHHSGLHRKVKTFYMFWPLVCGVPVPEETARDLIENVLLDPRQFFGPIPFPSVAMDEPQYQAGGYWRGKAWPHISFWLLRMLHGRGYRQEAEQAARRITAWFTARNGFLENMTSDPADVSPNGYPDYNWGCAAFALIAAGRYRD